MSVRNLMKGLNGALTPIQKSVFGAIERINKGKKAIYDSFRLMLFEMLHGGGIFKNGDFREKLSEKRLRTPATKSHLKIGVRIDD